MVTLTDTAGAVSPRPTKRQKPRALLLAGLTLPLILLAVHRPEPAHAPASTQPLALLAGLAEATPADPIFAASHFGLTPEDIARYARMFDAVDRADWGTVDEIAGQVTDRRLVGHAIAGRYLAEGATPSFGALRGWLDLYADLPEAAAIYQLAAVAQRPGDVATLPEPRGAETAAGSVANPDMVGSTEPRTEAAARAFARFAAKDDKGAVAESLRAIAQLGDRATNSHWIAGLASWRLGNLVEAERQFTTLAAARNASGWLQAAGAYWAGRVAERGESSVAETAGKWFARASRFPTTFYGLLAIRKLGVDVGTKLSGAALTPDHLDRLAQTPAGFRAVALLEIGRSALAAQELARIDPKGDPKMEEALVVVAQAKRLGDYSPTLAQRIAQPIEDAASSFPIPSWQPRGGFRIDPALMYAVARQESGFNPNVVSPAGAAGLMQLMPGTAGKMAGAGGAVGLLDPATNLDLGQRLIGALMRDPNIGENLLLLVAAYNGGSGNPAKFRQILEHDDPLLAIESVPKGQTREFIRRVLTNYWMYRARLGGDATSLDDLANGRWPRYQWDRDAIQPAAAR